VSDDRLLQRLLNPCAGIGRCHLDDGGVGAERTFDPGRESLQECRAVDPRQPVVVDADQAGHFLAADEASSDHHDIEVSEYVSQPHGLAHVHPRQTGNPRGYQIIPRLHFLSAPRRHFLVIHEKRGEDRQKCGGFPRPHSAADGDEPIECKPFVLKRFHTEQRGWRRLRDHHAGVTENLQWMLTCQQRTQMTHQR
jgi:hypothetical protein